MTRPDLDRFGGWTKKTFEATGFFRVEKDERWWIVSPEGNAFISFGINHLHPHFWNQPFNENSWKTKLGIEDLNSDEFTLALQCWFLDVCDEYGFNTVGVHNDLSVANFGKSKIPYVQPIEFVVIPHYSEDVVDDDFLDVFSDDFVQHCDELAKTIAAPLKDDPYLFAYAMTDCPLLTEEDRRERTDTIGGAPRNSRIGWPLRLRNLPSSAPGKIAYTELMNAIYKGNISSFNETYETSFKSFDDLKRTTDWRTFTDLSNANETRDNTEFLKKTVERYYSVARTAIESHDPNHMFIGDKLNANTDSLDTVLPVTSKYTDIVFIQMYGRYGIQGRGLDRWSKITDKPFINGDSSFTTITENMPRPYGPVADNPRQRAAWMEELFDNLLARPEVVGWHYCGLIDTPNLIPGKELRQHSGFLDPHGNPHIELATAIKTKSPTLYKTANNPPDLSF